MGRVNIWSNIDGMPKPDSLEVPLLIFGENNSAAKPYLREAYAAKHGSEDGFDEFLWSTRNTHAKVADDFELLDYEGNPYSLAEANGKVTLLAFWFPT